ncbi:MAG: exo-alpha-sialidase [Bacteroidales bacterium]|nr:exo-alpha-sialidase [Bacteroidales bacterium]
MNFKFLITSFRVLYLAAGLMMVVSFSGSQREDRISIFFLGDSITKGTVNGTTNDRTFPVLIRQMLSEHHFDAEITNLGIPNEKSDQALSKLKQDVISKKPDIVVVMYGTNDAFVDKGKTTERLPVESYSRNIANIVRQLQDTNIKVILMTPIPHGDFTGYNQELYKEKGYNFFIKPYISSCRQIAENHKILLADNYLHWEAKEYMGQDLDEWLTDGIHPNATGHQHIARTLFPAVLQACVNLPSKEVIIEKNEYKNLHFQAELRKKEDYIEISGVFGYLYADFIPGSGNFRIDVEFRIKEFNHAEPSLVLGDSEISFYEDGKNIMVSGLLAGYRNTSYNADSPGISVSGWIQAKIVRQKNEIRIVLNGKTLHTCYYLGDFEGKAGFKPGKAKIQIRNFEMKGNLIPVSTIPKSFSIPLIDLSDDTSRQVVIDREKGQYLGHPTTVLLEDNKTMFAVYPKGHGKGAIVMKKSEDAGKTWSARLPTPQNWRTSLEVPTIYRTESPDGNKNIIMFSGLNPCRMAFSYDDGNNWSQLEPIFPFGGIVVMSDLIRKKNGDYLTFFHDDGKFYTKNGKKTNRFFVYKSTSADGGMNWSDPEVVVHHKSAHLCEGGLIVSPDGSEWALLLRENSRQYNSMVIFSQDEGEIWSGPFELPASLTGDRHQLKYANDGRLIAVFRDMAKLSPTKGDFVGWIGLYDDLKSGNEGQCRIRLLKNHVAYDCGYPGFELLPDGTFLATTYGHWAEGESPYIVMVRFKLEEIDKYLNN